MGRRFLAILGRLTEQGVTVNNRGSKRTIVAVLSAVLVMDILYVAFRINPEAMFVYGVMLAGALSMALRGWNTECSNPNWNMIH